MLCNIAYMILKTNQLSKENYILSKVYIFHFPLYVIKGGFPTLKTLIFIIWVFTVLRRYFLRLINGTSFVKTRLSLSFKLQSENTISRRYTNKRQQFSNINPEYFSQNIFTQCLQ